MAEVANLEMRQAYCQTLQALARKDPRVVVLEADLMKASGTMPFKKEFPDRGIDCGIAESNMIGIASGLCIQGFIPFAATFGCFAARRTFDQFFLSANYARLNVKLTGTDPGVSAAYNGGTHMPFEDIGLMRMIPGIVIVETSDAVSTAAIVEKLYEHKGCSYLRLHRKTVAPIYAEGEQFELGKSKLLRKGTDVTLVGLGAVMMAQVLEAARLLEGKGISASVIDAISVKPLDADLIREQARLTGAIVTCENHQVAGGIGAAVADLLTEEGICCRLGRIGVEDRFGQVGTQAFLTREYHLDAESIAARACKLLGK